eukprot:scaffold1234_cov190-Alexandrium_tamarense.AAC.28
MSGGELGLEWCIAPDVGLPAPDCVIFLDLEQDEAEKRGGCGEGCSNPLACILQTFLNLKGSQNTTYCVFSKSDTALHLPDSIETNSQPRQLRGTHHCGVL